jgi:hypothetical protein
MRQSRMTVAVLTLFTADMLTRFTCYVRCRQIGRPMRQNGMTEAVFTLLAADTLYLLLRRFTCYESSRTTLPACTCCWHALLAADTLYLLWEQSHDIAGRYALAACCWHALLAADMLYLLLTRFTCYDSSRMTLPAAMLLPLSRSVNLNACMYWWIC